MPDDLIRRYVIVALSADGDPPVGTILPSTMTTLDGTVTISLDEDFYDPREFPELGHFLAQWGFSRGELPVNGQQITRNRL